MIKNINASDWSTWEDVDDDQAFDEMIGNKLDADYKTYYLGVSWYLPNIINKTKKYKKGNKGKMI
mgnify:CR=1 FL=1